jgi:sRNA-binding protein
MIAPMSETENTSAPAAGEPGVMGSLPKTRPQHASARRKAARSNAAAEPKPKATAEPKPKATASGGRAKGAKPATARKAKAEPPRAPRQGFEAESEVEPGKTVQPPGGAELAASVVELMGELAQSGLTSGGRLLKDVLSRLSPS